MKFKLILLWALIFVSGPCQSQVSTGLQQNDSLPLDPAVRYGKLENGFTYYLRNTRSPENKVRFNLVVKAGWDHEEDDQREYAHLLEHMLAKETRSYPNLKTHFYQEGRTRHAFTKTHSTEYFATIPRNDPQVFDDGLQVLLDWAQGNEWKLKSIAVERGAVEGEMRTSNPYRDWKTRKLEWEVLETIGYNPLEPKKSLKNIKNFNPEAFYRYYNHWYRPDLQAAIIVGEINVDSLERVIKKRFGALKGPSNPPDPKKYLDEQRIHFDGKIHFSTVTDSLEDKINLEIIKVRPNYELHPKSQRDYKVMLLQQLYMNLLSKRAEKFNEQRDRPFSYFWANYRSGLIAGEKINATQMRLELDSNYGTKLKSEFLKGIKAWKQMHLELDQRELEEVKTELLSNYRKPKIIQDFSERLQEHFVHGKAAPNPEVEEKIIKDLLKKVSVRELQIFVKEKGRLDKDTHFVFFKGKNTELPSYDVFNQWIKEVDTMQVEPLKTPVPPVESLEDVVEIASCLTSEDITVKKNLIGVSTVELPHGIKLVLKPTSPAMELYKNTVFIRGFRSSNIPINNEEAYLAAQAAPEVIPYNGAGPYSKFEIERFLNNKEMSLQLQLEKDNQLIYSKSKRDDLGELLNLLYLYLSHTKVDPEAFDAWKTNKRNELQGKGIRGSAEFIMDKIMPMWYSEVPVLQLDDLEKLDPEQVYSAKQHWFSSIENYTFIITGDFETENLLPVLIEKLSGFPTKKVHSPVFKKSFDFPLKKMNEKLEYKNIDAAYVRLFFPVEVSKDIKTQIELRLLSRALKKRIWDRLRQGSYAPIGTGGWLDKENGIYAMWIDFDSTLGDEEKMITWALEEFRNLKKYGVEKEWLENAINEEIRRYESGFGNFHYYDFWGDYLQQKLDNEENPEEEVLQYGTILEHFINLEDINTAAKNYLNEDHLQQFIGYPEDYLD